MGSPGPEVEAAELTLAEAAERAGLSVPEISLRIGAGDLPTRLVEVEGREEVRIVAADVDRLMRERAPGATAEPAGASASPADRPAAAQLAGTGRSELAASPEVRRLAASLADELFSRWELAMQQQFKEELALRLKSELDHRERQAADLREEVEQRAGARFGPRGRQVVGAADLYATWERRRTLIRQSREVAEMERQIQEMRQRLEGLGEPPEGSTLTVAADHSPSGPGASGPEGAADAPSPAGPSSAREK